MENSKNKEETKMSEVLNVEEIFGSKVFTLGKMRERLHECSHTNKVRQQKWQPVFPISSAVHIVYPCRCFVLIKSAHSAAGTDIFALKAASENLPTASFAMTGQCPSSFISL